MKNVSIINHISARFLLEWDIFQIKFVEKIKTHILYSESPPPKFCRLWKNIVQSDRPQTTVWRLRFACCIPKAINAHSEYVILIDYTYFACFSFVYFLLLVAFLEFCIAHLPETNKADLFARNVFLATCRESPFGPLWLLRVALVVWALRRTSTAIGHILLRKHRLA